jgi:hypothetical protein
MDSRPLIALALVAACAGPVPSAKIIAVAPSPEPGHERVTVAVRNDGGHGEVTLELTLRGHGGIVVRDMRHVDMDSHQRLSLAIDIAAPADTYTASVDVRYPD